MKTIFFQLKSTAQRIENYFFFFQLKKKGAFLHCKLKSYKKLK